MDTMVPNIMIFYTDKFKPDMSYVPLEYEDIMKGYYLINPYGDIYSIKLQKIMKQDTNHAGYKRICLITENGPRNFSVHRLVASTFIINPYPDLYTDVNHCDGNKSKNIYTNLEWCNNNQNKHHASENGLYQHGEDRYNVIYSDEFTRDICSKFQNGISYNEVYRMYQEMYPNSDSTIGSFIYKLYHRKTRNYITKEYKY